MNDPAKMIDRIDTLCQKWGLRFRAEARRVTISDPRRPHPQIWEGKELEPLLVKVLPEVQQHVARLAYARLNSFGTVGPWTVKGRPLTRSMVNEVAVLIAAGYSRAHYIAFQLDLPPEDDSWGRVLYGSDRRLDRALQLLNRWGVIAHGDQGWEWQPEAVKGEEVQTSEDLPAFDPDAEVDFEEAQEHDRTDFEEEQEQSTCG